MSIVASVYGRAGQDGELRTSSNGKPWCRLSVVLDAGKDREGRPIDVWVTLVAFGTKADDLALVRKGGSVSAIGRLELSRWTDKQGAARESWQLVCDEVVTARSARPAGPGKARAGTSPQSATCEAKEPSDGVPFDDDIPF